MTNGSIGETVPAWVREQVRRREAAWPLIVLSAALAALLVVGLVAGGILWTAEPPPCYARP